MGDIEQLNERYGIAGKAAVVAGKGGLPRVDITSAAAEGSIYLHGAHVSSYRPNGAEPVLFVSGASYYADGQPIRGGVPICFPWFGPNAKDPDTPAHGLARLAAWSLAGINEQDGGVGVTLTHRIEPYELRFECVFGPSLAMRLHVTNASKQVQRFEAALHTYFRVSDVREVQVTGLEDAAYFSKVERGHKPPSGEPIRFIGETDRVYQDTLAACVLHDPGLRRRIRIEKTGSRSTVVWNPWIDKAARMADFGDDEWPGMCCIETAAVEPNAVDLPAGGSAEISARITVSGL